MRALKPVRTVAPAAALFSLDEAKAHLRLETDEEDAYVAALIAAAEAYLDGHAGVLGRALVTQTWQQSFDCFPNFYQSWQSTSDPNRGRYWEFRLPLGPLGAVSSITYYAAGAPTTLSSSVYRALTDAIGPLVELVDGETWPLPDLRGDAVTVTWTCGYGASAASVPAPILHAGKLLIGHWYRNRESVSLAGPAAEVPMAVDALLMPFRAVGL